MGVTRRERRRRRRLAGRNRRVSLRDLVNLLCSGGKGDKVGRARDTHRWIRPEESSLARGSHRVASRSRHAGQDGGREFRTGPERTLRTEVSRTASLARSDPRPIPLCIYRRRPRTVTRYRFRRRRPAREEPAMTRLALFLSLFLFCSLALRFSPKVIVNRTRSSFLFSDLLLT